MKLHMMFMTFFLGLSLQVQAFTFPTDENFSFPTNTIHVDLADGSDCDGAGISNSEFFGLLKEANEMYWNKVSSSALELKMGNRTGDDFSNETDTTPIVNAAGDNRILATCNTDLFNASPESIGGLGALSCPNGQGQACRGVFILNGHPDSIVQDLSRIELLAIIGHEIGHALGLGHTSVEEALMYYSISFKSQEYLHLDDMLGISYLYPHDKKAGGLLGACGTIALIDRGGPGDGPGSGGGMAAVATAFILGLLALSLARGRKRISLKLHKPHSNHPA